MPDSIEIRLTDPPVPISNTTSPHAVSCGFTHTDDFQPPAVQLPSSEDGDAHLRPWCSDHQSSGTEPKREGPHTLSRSSDSGASRVGQDSGVACRRYAVSALSLDPTLSASFRQHAKRLISTAFIVQARGLNRRASLLLLTCHSVRWYMLLPAHVSLLWLHVGGARATRSGLREVAGMRGLRDCARVLVARRRLLSAWLAAGRCSRGQQPLADEHDDADDKRASYSDGDAHPDTWAVQPATIAGAGPLVGLHGSDTTAEVRWLEGRRG